MAMSKGCTIALVVFAIFVLLLIIGMVVVWINKDKIAEASLDYIVKAAEREITADIPPESVHRIMTALKEGIRSKEINAQETKRIADAFQAAITDKKIDQTEGAHILQLIVEALPPGAISTDSMPGQVPVDSLQAVPDSI
jgi:uncharacterized membrane protein